jgi:membrane protein
MRHRAVEVWRLLTTAYRGFERDGGWVTAGAIAFFSILGLVPIALLGFTLFARLLGSEAHQEFEATVQQLLPGGSRPVLDAIAAYSRNPKPLVELVGTLGLLWSGTSLFVVLSHILTTIWVGRRERSYLAQRLVGLLALLAGGLLFLVNMLAAGVIAALRAHEELLGPLAVVLHDMHFLGSMAPFFLSAVFAALGFFLLYRFLPNGSVSTRAAALAALPAAMLWLASRALFSVLVAGSSHYGQVYGPLAGAVVLLLWIYYTAYIMIFCAELGVAAQGRYWPKAGPSRPLDPV